MSDLTKIPGIGKRMAQHLVNAGYPDIESLKGKSSEEIYAKHCMIQGPGYMSCKCTLYCYRLAVYYADHDGQLPSNKQNWSDWKD